MLVVFRGTCSPCLHTYVACLRPVGLAIRTGRSVWRARRGNKREAGVHTCAFYRMLDPTGALCIDCDAHATSEQAHGRGDDDDDHLRVSDYMTETLLAVAATMRARDPRSELNQARVWGDFSRSAQ